MISMQQARRDTAAELERTNVITVVLCGTGVPMEPTRAQACTAVFVGGRFLLFDVGDGAKRSMDSLKLPFANLQAVFLTHYHSDHFADLGEVINRSWLTGRRRNLIIFGPQGLTKVVNGFLTSYSLENGYRTAHHGPEMMPPQYAGATPTEFEAPTSDEPLLVYDQDGVVVKAFKENHPPVTPAVGYRIEYGDKVVVISGDTTTTQALLEQSRGADLLVSEVMNMDLVRQMEASAREGGFTFRANIFHAIYEFHMNVNDVGKLAEEAKVKRLALTHLMPPIFNNDQVNVYFKQPIQKLYHGEVFVGDDGLRIVIPL